MPIFKSSGCLSFMKFMLPCYCIFHRKFSEKTVLTKVTTLICVVYGAIKFKAKCML